MQFFYVGVIIARHICMNAKFRRCRSNVTRSQLAQVAAGRTKRRDGAAGTKMIKLHIYYDSVIFTSYRSMNTAGIVYQQDLSSWH